MMGVPQFLQTAAVFEYTTEIIVFDGVLDTVFLLQNDFTASFDRPRLSAITA